MSHRVNTSTKMTDAAIALRMLKAQGLSGKVEGTKIAVSGAKLRSYVPTVIDLSSGKVEGDGDNQRIYDGFDQAYAVASCFMQAESEGATHVEEEVLPDGRVRHRFQKY